MKRLRSIALGTVILLIVGVLSLAVWARTVPRPSNLGISGGQLAACPGTPNCVATERAETGRLMAPLLYTARQEEAQARLAALLRRTPRTTIVGEQPGYLATEFRTPVIGFVDDVEFRFDDNAKVIHFRSASRLGRSDLGVNRARMEALGRAWGQTSD